MRLAAAAAVALLALTLPACGDAKERDGAGARESRAATAGPDAGAAAQRPGGRLALRPIGRFREPVHVAAAPGYPRLLFVVEQPGRVVVLRGGRRAGSFLDLRRRVGYGGERGLLSIAFPPDYRSSGRFYVYYTDRAGTIRVDEFRRRGTVRAAPGSRRPVLAVPHPRYPNHNGGQLQFLGELLFIGTGDGGSGGDPENNAQSLDSLLGKLLRIDPRPSGGRPYTVPPDNPFVGRPGRDEIYSYGLRNPFRFSFDTVSGARPRIAIGDVGQDRFEEIDYTTVERARGANFGWDALEGFAPYRGANAGTPDPGGTVKPIFAYPRGRGGSCSVIGGYVVRDRSLHSIYRRYVYADHCEGRLRALAPRLGRVRRDRPLPFTVPRPASFGEDARGRLYVTSLDGPVYRLVER